jgi:hypothetical protein
VEVDILPELLTVPDKPVVIPPAVSVVLSSDALVLDGAVDSDSTLVAAMQVSLMAM